MRVIASRHTDTPPKAGAKMGIADLLAPTNILLDIQVVDKGSALAELSRRSATQLGIDPKLVLAALNGREQLGSTGMGGGIAIPHARIPGVAKPFGVFVRLKNPIEFDAIDDRRVDLIFLLLLPAGQHGEQINALACVARRLRDTPTAGSLRNASNASAIYGALTG